MCRRFSITSRFSPLSKNVAVSGCRRRLAANLVKDDRPIDPLIAPREACSWWPGAYWTSFRGYLVDISCTGLQADYLPLCFLGRFMDFSKGDAYIRSPKPINRGFSNAHGEPTIGTMPEHLGYALHHYLLEVAVSHASHCSCDQMASTFVNNGIKRGAARSVNSAVS